MADESRDACIRKIDICYGNCVVFSHKGDRVAACGGIKDEEEDIEFLVIIEANTGIVLFTLRGHNDEVTSVAFSPDDSLLVSGSNDHMIRLWDIQTGGLVRAIAMDDEVRSVGFSHDGMMIGCNFGIWNSTLTKLRHEFDEEASSWAWSPIKAELALGYESGQIKVMDAANGTYRWLFPAHESEVECLAYSRDGKKVASGSLKDPRVTVHDAETGDNIHSFPTDSVLSVCFSHDEEKLVVAQANSMVICDLAGSVNIAEFKQLFDAISVSVSPDGTSVAVADPKKLSIWRMQGIDASRSPEATPRHSDYVSCIAISPSPNSSFCASSSFDGTVKLWDLATGACLHTLEGHLTMVWCVAISPDSTLVASGEEGTILIWSAADHVLLYTLQAPSNATVEVPQLQFLVLRLPPFKLTSLIEKSSCFFCFDKRVLIASLVYFHDGQYVDEGVAKII